MNQNLEKMKSNVPKNQEVVVIVILLRSIIYFVRKVKKLKLLLGVGVGVGVGVRFTY